MSESKKPMIQNNTVYDTLKYIMQIALPALGSLYFGLSQIWNLPYGAEVVGTIVVLVTFLGALLRVSATPYHNSDARFDGSIDIFENEDRDTFALNLDDDPYSLKGKTEVVFKVCNVSNDA